MISSLKSTFVWLCLLSYISDHIQSFIDLHVKFPHQKRYNNGHGSRFSLHTLKGN